jgi:hypothetical protein
MRATNPLGLPDSVGAALEHAYEPGVDPALPVLAHALERELARRFEETAPRPARDPRSGDRYSR